MVAKKAVVVKSDAAIDELLSPDIWSKDQCNVCQDVCVSRESKITHSKTPRHTKKVAIFKFFTQDAAKLSGSGKPSKLLDRYKDRGHEAIGLDCIHELVFPFAESGWWACSLCYDSGFNYDQVDEHLSSANHLQCYIDEFHPAKAKKMEKGWSQTERLEYLLDAKKQIYHEEKQKGAEAIAPEIIELTAWTLLMARKKLMVDDTKAEYAVHPVADDSSNVMMQCLTCHEVLPCRKDYVKEAWALHKVTERHARLATINGILRQYHFDRVQEEDRLLSELSEEAARWKRVDDRVYGPVCGIKYLRSMGGTSLCTLCGVVADGVDEHFASEHHLMRFVCTQSPRDAWQMMQASKEARRAKLLAMVQAAPRENEESGATKEACPSRLTWAAVESEGEQLPSFPPPQEPFGFNSTCVSCAWCWQAVPTPAGEDANAIWNEHVTTGDHLDYAARRVTIEYDESFFVPLASSVQLLPKESHGTWVTESVDDQVMWKYQTQTDVGLEYVVEDAEQGLAVCTLCARSYPLGEHCQMGMHVRSLQHLQQYLHVANRTMLSMVFDTKPEAACDELMLEFLVRNTVSQVDEIRVFNKKKAKELESWPNVKVRTMQVTTLATEDRPTYECLFSIVDQIANDKEALRSVSAREALASADMKEITVTKMTLLKTGLALLKCSACDICFVVTPSQLEQDVWEKHIGSEEHHRRTLAFTKNKFAPLYFTPLSSTYTVKPFVQKDPTKKVTWRWNVKDKSHDLVLAIVGLEELVEKKSEDTMVMNDASIEDYTAHFFCRVCAVDVGRRAQMLEDHVRSGTHVNAYVNKHFPQTVLELDRLDNTDGGKERRKILANLLKDIKPPAEYCIPVYDPIGESERRQKEAEIKHKQREALKKNEEMRAKAMEERKIKDEAKRKAKEEETKRERQREEERKKREEAVLQRAAAVTAENERMRKIAMEKAALADIARRKEELAHAQSQVTRDPGIAALLSTRNQVAAQLDALRAAKAVGAIPEPRLLIPGPNQLASSTVQNSISHMPTVHISGAQSAGVSGAGMLPNMAMPPPGMMMMPGMFSLPPPSMMMGVPPPNPYSLPPPSLMSMSVPPPSMGVPPPSHSSSSGMIPMADLVGPKPVLSSFVPKVDAMPVYPSQGGSIGTTGHKRDFDRPSLAGAAPDMYATNAAIITNRQALVDYMWKQGNEETPESERPARFSRLCAATPACLGMEYIYEVVCLDSGELTTMYCSMCAYWSTPGDTLKHMQTASHRLLYLFRNYKLYHRTVESEVEPRAKEILLEQFAMQIRSRDNPPPFITHRLKCYLNTATIQRLWPQYVTVLDQSWRTNPVCRTPSPQPMRRGRSRSYSDDSRSRSYSRSSSRSPKDRYSRRSRSRDRDQHGRRRSSRSRSRSPRARGRDGRRRSYSRSRSATPEKKPDYQPWQPASASAMMPMNTAVRPPSSAALHALPNMAVPPPGLMSLSLTTTQQQPKPMGVPPPSLAVITLDDEDMQIATTPPSSERKKDDSRRERERERDSRERSRRDKDSKSSPARDRERRRDSDATTRRDKERDERREREKKKEKEAKDEVVDPIREEQRRKALERVKDLERSKKGQKEREKEKETEDERQRRRKQESADDRLRRDRRERSRERRRSPSPSRKRRRSESRERRSSHRSSNGASGGGEVDWDSKAAAFLAKIGDLQGASKLIQAGVSSQQASSSPYGVSAAAPPIYNGAPAARPSSGMGGSTHADAKADFGAGMGAGKKAKVNASPAYEPLDESPPPPVTRGGRPTAAAAAAAAHDEDPTTTQRKMFGVLMAMQAETDAGRELSAKDVDKLYQEVGLKNQGPAKNQELLAELIEMVGGRPGKTKNINLQDYGIGVTGSPAQQQQQHHGSPYYGAPSSSSSRAPPPSAGYGSPARDYYGAPPPSQSSRGGDPRGVPSALAGMDAEGLELLKNLSSTLKLMQSRGQPAPSAGPRSLPMPPGFSHNGGRPEYDGRREAYPPPRPSDYPAYRSPPDDERLRRPSPYDPYGVDPRVSDPRMRGDPRYGAPPPQPDPRYGAAPSYYDDPRYDGRERALQQQLRPAPGGYPSEYDRDPRGGGGAPLARDPRDSRGDPRDAHMQQQKHQQQQQRPSMGGVDPRLYEPPPQRAERPPLTREEYEARLRGEISPNKQMGSAAAPKPATAPQAQPQAAKKADLVTIVDDDDDWGALEQILEKAKGAPGGAGAASTGRQTLMATPPGGGTPTTAAAAAPPAMTEKEANKLRYMQGMEKQRQHWGVRNKAEPAPQPHLSGQPPPQLQYIGGDPAPPRQPSNPQPLAQQAHGGVAIGGAWDAAAYAAHVARQEAPSNQQRQAQIMHKAQLQGYYGEYDQNGGYSASYGGGGGNSGGGYY